MNDVNTASSFVEITNYFLMQTMILDSAQSTSKQRDKRTRKGKQPIQDDQPRPESSFRLSWVRALPENCNQVIRDLFQLHFVKNNVTYLF
jgi:hypothetical protein